MNTAELFIKALEIEGVEYIFGLAGEENLHFLQALSKSKIKYISTRNEQSAAFMAATFGRLTGKVGVVLTTLGPGATNLITAAAYALLGGMPLLMITGQKPIDSFPQGDFQIIDFVSVVKPVTKFTKQIVSAKSLAYLVRKAVKIAEAEKPGPVHLELPKDIAQENVNDNITPLSLSENIMPVASSASINKVVKLLSSAKLPLIMIGASASRHSNSQALIELVTKFNIPFFDSQMGKGVIDERDPNFLGTAALVRNDYIHDVIASSDLIINVGYESSEKPPYSMVGLRANVIHLNYTPAEITEIYFPQLEIVGDIEESIKNITSQLNMLDMVDIAPFAVDLIAEQKSRIERSTLANQTADNFPILPQRIVGDIRKFMGENDILALDNGMYKLWFSRSYKVYQTNTLLLDNALATMGAGLPSGIAAKLLNPNVKVLVVTGDGGFMMNSQELETAVRLNLDLVVLIINDNGFGMIKWEQAEKNFTNFGLDFKNPDFIKLAESYGAKGYRLTSASDLIPTLTKAFSGGVALIEVAVDYSENIKVFTHELHNKLA